MLLALAVGIATLWEARSLPLAWLATPSERLGGVFFLPWLLPIVVRPTVPPRTWVIAALALVTLGSLMDLNFLRLLALALAVGGWTSRGRWQTLVGAFAWMPLLGWWSIPWPLRLLLALLPLLPRKRDSHAT